MIAIVDYRTGNVQSIQNALGRIGAEGFLTRRKRELERADALILPGVGSFSCIERMGRIRESVLELLDKGKPLFGICLGMQALFEKSEESPGVAGLGVFSGVVRKFPERDGMKLPQIGWNRVKKIRSVLLSGIPDNAYFYFANSYYAEPEERSVVRGVSCYSCEFPAVVEKGNVFAVQFHPEKSGKNGFKLLENFVEAIR